MFNPGMSWWEFDDNEKHAFLYGLLSGLQPWKRKSVATWSEIDALDIAPAWKAAIKEKYWYYYTMFEAPELIVELVAAYSVVHAIGITTAAQIALKFISGGMT
ncbi:hypothetical protein [uncultured Methanoregula sp.]|uniref:hypothetical protein n=1 Tax=uncultured Methanoregula sp. TaxID=1005933 RepID=UPI002AAADB09|nr:hypothetical protein [uncultured Methanoregula sp.]